MTNMEEDTQTTHLEETRYNRQSDIVNRNNLDFRINVIGAGATGSWLALFLTKMGCNNVCVWDSDDIEEHNISNQFYNPEDSGRPKVKALKKNILKSCGHAIETVEGNFRKGDRLTGVVVICVDSMDARRNISTHLVESPLIEKIIDIRVGGEQVELYSADTVEEYDKLVYNDDGTPSEAINESCNARSIVYNVTTAAALACNEIKRYASQQPVRKNILMHLNTLEVIK